MLTSSKLAARTDRAVAAAGRDLGPTVTDPRVLYDVFSVVVHLSPAPVVGRVPTVLPRTVAADPDAQAAQQRRELAVAGWLADRGHPVVAPLVASRAAFHAAFPGADVQPIHGDAPFYNIIGTPEGVLCSDFEHVTLGPIEWDLVGVGPPLPMLAEGLRPSLDHWRATRCSPVR